MSLVLRLSVFGLACAGMVGHAFAGSDDTSGSAVVREMNLARQNPSAYATYLEELRGNFQGNLLMLPGRIPFQTKEGVRAVDEAICFLRTAAPQAPLNFSPGMSRAAADHCAAQVGGGMSHSGRGGSNTGDRISRYGVWGGTWGENLSCGRRGARETVIALIVDDGLGSRKHRKNIFSPSFAFAGAAIGQHAQYHTICSIEFAGDYVEAGQTAQRSVTSARTREVDRAPAVRELFATNGL
ncbi:MAG: CAP domain-containing protein [Chthoniobacterales bacterium]